MNFRALNEWQSERRTNKYEKYLESYLLQCLTNKRSNFQISYKMAAATTTYCLLQATYVWINDDDQTHTHTQTHIYT